MKINAIQVSNSDDKLVVSAEIESENIASRKLWFSVSKEYENYICTTQMDAFLIGMLFLAMEYGEDLYIDGSVSKKLLFNVNKYVIPLLMSYSSSAKKIRVSAKNVNNEGFNANGIGTGFSGGVDSFSAIHELFIKEEDPTLKINTLLFLNVGSHGKDEDLAKAKYLKRYFHLEDFPKEINIDYIQIDSNLHTFHPWGHEKTHTLTSAAGVLILQKHFCKYYYASAGFNYSEIIDFSKEHRDKDLGAYCDPILLPLLSTETTEFYFEGAAYNRIDKILGLSDYEPTFRYLNVCVNGDDTHENCSTCSKCLRTLYALDLSGNLDKYSKVFDLEKYKKIKTFYVSHLVLSQKKDVFAKTLIELAKDKEIQTPNKLMSKLIVLYHRKVLKKLLKFINAKNKSV